MANRFKPALLVLFVLVSSLPAKGQQPPKLDVPYVPTATEVVEAMLKMAEVKKGDVIYDLGCGDGRIVIAAVKKYGAKKGIGIDIDPERIKDSKANAKKEGVEDKVEFKQGDILKHETVADADVVALYLLPEINLKIRPMLQKTMKKGARLVSHNYSMGDWKYDKKEEVRDGRGIGHTVYLWTIK